MAAVATAAPTNTLGISPSAQSRHRHHKSPHQRHHSPNALTPSRSQADRQLTTLSPQTAPQINAQATQQFQMPFVPQPVGATVVPQFVEHNNGSSVQQNADTSTLPPAGQGGDDETSIAMQRQQLMHSMMSNNSRTHEGHIRIGMKWTLGQRIGAGNFGQVYIGYDIDGFQKFCIKMEKGDSKSPQLSREYRFYHMLRGHHGFPRVYWYGQVQKYNCLVMDLLGPSLDDLHGLCSRRFSLKTTCLIALQLIDRFEVLHSKGLIYRDVKPENFLLGRRTQSKENVVFVVDMGLAKLYRDARTGEHLPEAFGQAVTGTARYMSVNANFGNEQSRRDDMEALGHLLVFFLRSRLPWQGLKPGNAVKDHIRLIGQVKRDTAVSELCEGLPEEFSLYISYCRHLDFYGKPDYEYLRELFIDLCERHGWKDDGMFDWTEREDEIMRHSQHSLPREPVRLGSQESHVGGGGARKSGGHHHREKSKPPDAAAGKPPEQSAIPATARRKPSLPTVKPNELPPSTSMSYMAPAKKDNRQHSPSPGGGGGGGVPSDKKAKSLKPTVDVPAATTSPGGGVAASKSVNSRSPNAPKRRTSKRNLHDPYRGTSSASEAASAVETTQMPPHHSSSMMSNKQPHSTLSSTVNKILNSKLSKKFSSVLPASHPPAAARGASGDRGAGSIRTADSSSAGSAGSTTAGSVGRRNPTSSFPRDRHHRRAPNADASNNNDDNSSIIFKFLCIRIRRKRERRF